MKLLYWSLIGIFFLILLGCGGTVSNRDLSTWNKESGTRLTNTNNPFVLKLSNGNYRIYYVASSEIKTALSTNEGESFATAVTGLSASITNSLEAVINNPCVVQESLTSYRMYYQGKTTEEATPKHHIFTAISSDGITFIREGIALTAEATGDLNSVSSPFVIKLLNSSYRMYYVSKDFMIKTATSESGNGKIFARENNTVLGASYADAAVSPYVITVSGNYKLFYGTEWNIGRGGPTKIMSAISSDGITFTEDGNILIGLGLTTDTYLVNKPSVTQLTNGNYRMFYAGTTDGTTYNLLSATKEASGI